MSKLVFDFDKFRFVKSAEGDKEVNVLASFPMALGRKIEIIGENEYYYIKGIEKIKLSNMRITCIRWNCVFGSRLKQELEHYNELSDGQLYDVVTIPDIHNEIGFTYVFGNSADAKMFINSMMDFASSLVMIGATKEENDIECY